MDSLALADQGVAALQPEHREPRCSREIGVVLHVPVQLLPADLEPVSYTHLTLPTICSV